MKNCIGIRHENKDLTERRAPLTPDLVKKIVEEHGIRVLVEPSETRIFREAAYRDAGAEISEDLSDCNIIFGVKEIPKASLQQDLTYCFFSHTIKAQDYNMPLLAKLMALGNTLLDYEVVTNEEGRRQIFFGNFAGYAGMINSLWALGKRWAWEGIANPLETIQQTLAYDTLADAETAIETVGETILREGLPREAGPLICGFTGYGQVSKGAQKIYDVLPVETITPEELAGFYEKGDFSANHVYKVEFHEKHMFVHARDEVFDLQEYFNHPERYKNQFYQYTPFLTMIINAIYWEPTCPMLISKSDLKTLYEQFDKPNLKVIGDISCDIEGSMQMTVKATNSTDPIYVFDPFTEAVTDGHAGRGPVMMTVDKLPAELPREASDFFGNSLLPYVAGLAQTDFSEPLASMDIHPHFKKAMIVHKGELTSDFEYLKKYISE